MERITLGAEVALEYGLSNIENISELSYEFSNYILLEFPYRPFSERMLEELNNIHYDYMLTPVIAHIDRYIDMFTENDYRKILSLDDVILQINNDAFLAKKTRDLIDRLIIDERPFVLGSDCHNLSNRAPNFNLPISFLGGYSAHPMAQDFLSYIK